MHVPVLQRMQQPLLLTQSHPAAAVHCSFLQHGINGFSGAHYLRWAAAMQQVLSEALPTALLSPFLHHDSRQFSSTAHACTSL